MLLLLSFIGSLLFVFGTAPYNCELLPGDERLDNGDEEKQDTRPSLKERTVANNSSKGKDFIMFVGFVCSIVVVVDLSATTKLLKNLVINFSKAVLS